jgi:hypothetical protein
MVISHEKKCENCGQKYHQGCLVSDKGFWCDECLGKPKPSCRHDHLTNLGVQGFVCKDCGISVKVRKE